VLKIVDELEDQGFWSKGLTGRPGDSITVVGSSPKHLLAPDRGRGLTLHHVGAGQSPEPFMVQGVRGKPQ